MMIHGYYYKTIYKDNAIANPCPNCKQTFALCPSVMVKVSHINYIPFQASKKTACLICNVCSEKFNINLFVNNTISETRLLAAAKHKWYHFTGLFLLIFILLTAFYFHFQMKNETNKREVLEKKYMAAKLKNSSQNEVIFYKIENDEITSFKVSKVQRDTLFGFENTLSINNKSNYTRIDKPENYSKKETFHTQQELQKMLEDNKIMYNIN